MRFNPDEYVTVHERIERFYAKYPNGRLTTTIIEHSSETGFILIRAEAFRESDDALPAATGHAYELRSSGHVQQGSYVEVCETSAVGRALALLGFEVRRGIVSREEMEKAARKQTGAAPARQPERPASPPEKPAQQQVKPTPPPEPPLPSPALAAEPSAAASEPSADLDAQILLAAEELGYDAAKVRKWVNQKYEVTGGLGSLTPHDKREVLKIFREQSRQAPVKAARK
jgi:hypothetical protein